MTQALTLEPRARVLEIGTGSGYQTAVLSRLSRLVYTVERYRTLLREAEARFEAAAADQCHHQVRRRRRRAGPSRRLSTAFWSRRRRQDEPKTLLEQLKPSGVLVAPIGRGPVQKLCRYAGDGKGGFTVEILCEVRFVPLLDGVAREL